MLTYNNHYETERREPVGESTTPAHAPNLACDTAPETICNPAANRGAVSSKRTVLHVDDDPAMLDVSSDWADVRDELDWLTASDPQTGLEMLSTHDVDCLVSDSFRAADGEPFVTRVTTTFPDLPVVLFTSTTYDALDPALRDSQTEYVRKGSAEPFDDLFDRVLTVTDESADSSSVVEPAPRAATRNDGGSDAGQWVPIGRYRPAEGDDLATVVVTAVEAYTGRDTTAFPPLYEAIDADALSLLVRRADGRQRDAVQIRFVYADCELAVTGDGVVLARD